MVCCVLLLLCLAMSLKFLIFPRLLPWRSIGFAFSASNEMIIFFLSVCLYSGLHWWISVYWTITACLGWSQRKHMVCTNMWILAQNLGIPKIQFTDQEERRTKCECFGPLVLLRRESKIPTGASTETKCGAETEGKAHKLPHLGIYSTYSHQMQTLLWIPRTMWWEESDIAVCWEALEEPDNYRGWC